MKSYTITWCEVQGLGRLIAKNEDGEIIRQESYDDPIDAGTDSDAIANLMFGDTQIVAVDHDREFIHVHVDWS